MNVEITGRIKEIFEAQTFNSGFKKLEFVVTTQEQYPQDLKLELVQDKVDLINGMNKGDEVKAQVNLRGNEYQGRYFVNLQAWRVEKVQPEASSNPGMPSPPPSSGAPLPNEPAPFDTDGEDDLPF
tara:strand:- start:10703 stop:11080 length:378 start_codon:yes stop_codon:yes gene_type:complete